MKTTIKVTYKSGSNETITLEASNAAKAVFEFMKSKQRSYLSNFSHSHVITNIEFINS